MYWDHRAPASATSSEIMLYVTTRKSQFPTGLFRIIPIAKFELKNSQDFVRQISDRNENSTKLSSVANGEKYHNLLPLDSEKITKRAKQLTSLLQISRYVFVQLLQTFYRFRPSGCGNYGQKREEKVTLATEKFARNQIGGVNETEKPRARCGQALFDGNKNRESRVIWFYGIFRL